MAGGLDKFADKNEIKVVRLKGSKQQILPVDYSELMSGDDMSTNIHSPGRRYAGRALALRDALRITLLALRTTGVATATLILSCSGVAYAATWQPAIALPSTVEYDSNPVLLTSGEKGVTRTIIAPDLNLVGTSGRDELQFGLGVNVVRSSDTDIVSDREDPRLKLGWQRETETGGFGLTASMKRARRSPPRFRKPAWWLPTARKSFIPWAATGDGAQ